MKKIGNIVSTIVMVCLIIIAGFLYVPKLFSITPMVVLSGSMEPTYPVGSLIFVKALSPSTEIEQGDNVTFYFGNTKTVVTHRVIAVNEDNTYATKGDANNTEDGGNLQRSSIIGIANDFCVPFLGYLAAFLNTKAGFAVMIGVIVLVVASSFIKDSSKKKKKEVGEKRENDEKS